MFSLNSIQNLLKNAFIETVNRMQNETNEVVDDFSTDAGV